MEFASDARALGGALFYPHVKLPCEVVQPQTVKQPGKTSQAKHARQLKPPRLPECGVDSKRKRCCGAIPQAIAVRSPYPELVGPWPKIGVDGLPGNHRVAPGVIKAVQTIAETKPVGAYKAQRRIIDHETALRRRDTDRPLEGDRVAIDQDILYPGCRRQQLMIGAVWMHHGEA